MTAPEPHPQRSACASRENRPIAAGRTVRKRQGAKSVSATTTTASGRWTWLPMALEKAAAAGRRWPGYACHQTAASAAPQTPQRFAAFDSLSTMRK
jgi:hypothetical protein